jgi:ribosome-binding factor A
MRRPEKFAERIREEVSEIVGYELSDPRLLSVTVTDVVVADNLRDAKVFVMVEGSEAEVKAAMMALKNAETYVRQQLALSLDLHHAPHIHFVRDVVGERASRVDKILRELDEKGEFNKGKADQD